MYVWIKTFFNLWTELMCLTLKIVFLTCSASVCEDRWSIEDSIHSKRRNRLGREIVERLVCIHSNLKFDHRLDLYETGMFPWDIHMTEGIRCF
jgi:hypothetical protein